MYQHVCDFRETARASSEWIEKSKFYILHQARYITAAWIKSSTCIQSCVITHAHTHKHTQSMKIQFLTSELSSWQMFQAKAHHCENKGQKM